MMRIIIFLITNIAVVLLFGMVMMFVGVKSSQVIYLLIISGIIGFGGSIISLLISKYVALLSVNGRVLKNTTSNSTLECWLLNIIRDQSFRLGIVMPQVAVYDACDMNAFATGFKKDRALVAVSTGLLEGMTHDEIEAVIAHEMTHICNGDMVTMTLIQGVINTFVIFVSRMLTQFLYYCMSAVSYSNDDDSRDCNDNSSDSSIISEHSSSVYYCLSMILELIFGILASIIVLWFSRRREFYADAGSAKLVGCDKMIQALEKLKLSYASKESNLISSYCINGSINNQLFSELFMTHPTLDKRIQALRCGDYLNKSSCFNVNDWF